MNDLTPSEVTSPFPVNSSETRKLRDDLKGDILL